MKYVCTFILIAVTVLSNAQNSTQLSDSLKLQIEKSANDSLRVYYKLELANVLRRSDYEISRQKINEVLKTIDSSNYTSNYYKSKKGLAYNLLGSINYSQSNFEKAIQNQLTSLEIGEKINDSVLIGRTLHSLGMLFRAQKDFNKSIDYFKKAIIIRKHLHDADQLGLSYNMLGVAYYYNRQNDSAISNYKKAEKEYPTELGKIKARANMATLYYTYGKYPEALSIYSESNKYFKESGNTVNLAINYSHMGKIYSDIGQHRTALKYADLAIEVLLPLQHHRLISVHYHLRSIIYGRMENYKKALSDFKMHKTYLDSVNDFNKVKRLTELEMKYEFNKEKLADSLNYVKKQELAKAEIVSLDAKNKSKKLMIALVVLIALFLLIYYRQRMKNIRLTNSLLENEIEHNKKDLSNYSLNIIQNQNWLKEFASKLNNIKSLGKGEGKLLYDIVEFEKEITNKIWVNDNHEEFSQKVRELGNSFFIKLNDKFKNLTNTDVRLCTLIKLNMNNKDIALIQNISPDSVKKSRYRLRKKLNLTTNQNLNDFLRDF